MIDSPSSFSIRARWVVPVTQPPIENGRVTIANGRIVSIEKIPRASQPSNNATSGNIDYGDAIVLPGFVNAHTHLELSHAHGRVPYNDSFVDWLRGVLTLQSPDEPTASRVTRVHESIAASLAAGVTAIADITSQYDVAEAWRSSLSHLVGFFETTGMGPRRTTAHPRFIETAIDACEQATRRSTTRTTASDAGSLQHAPDNQCHILGISPHAPYSTAPEVYRRAIVYCRSHSNKNVPLCSHLAETRDEIEFLKLGTGPFRELLESLGLWDGSFSLPGCSPVEYAARLGLLDERPLLAHVNYVDDADLDRLAQSAASVAYCPRTHRFFQHEPHPFERMLTRGINVCLGTDSLASTDSLSILDEMRFLRAHHAGISDAAILKMATIRGARALGLESQIGSLDVGKRADFCVIPLQESSAADPLNDLLASPLPPTAVYMASRQVVAAG